MARGIKLKTEGFDELLKAIDKSLIDITEDMQGNNQDDAEMIASAAKSRVKKVSGDLADSIDVIRVEKSVNGKKKVVHQVGPNYQINGVDYGQLIETGYKTKTGKQVPAQPYLRPSLDKNKKSILKSKEDMINKAMERLGL